ncbi:MAG: Na/Pi cotransporter family protein, partial [Clostridia bacterium]|nr:Na/Pi cotransporter family protein [Clostridia bacterium]
TEHGEQIRKNEEIIDFTNSALTGYLIKLSSKDIEEKDEKVIGAYFHVLNDLERIGDHAENFHDIGAEMLSKNVAFSKTAGEGIEEMSNAVTEMFTISKNVFENTDKEQLSKLTAIEESVDGMKRTLMASHFARLAEGSCNANVSPYYSSVVTGLERVADHLVNVGFSVVNPIGSQKVDV